MAEKFKLQRAAMALGGQGAAWRAGNKAGTA